MSEVKCVNIKFKPTGNVFYVSIAEANRLLKEDRGNYEVLDEDFVYPAETDVVETTVFEQVIENDAANEQKDEESQPTFEEILEKKKVQELIEYCDENKIEYNKNDKKADLISKILAANEQKDEESQPVTEEQTEE